MSRESDMTLCDIARICDVFYIGGTKVGALCGEAVVFTKNNKPRHFMTSVKSGERCWLRGGCWAFSLTRCLRMICILKSAATPSRWRSG